MSAVDLLPCAHCGAPARYELAFGVRCTRCGAGVPCRADDVSPWNRRAPDSAGTVKPLVWEQLDPCRWRAGSYRIMDDGEAYEALFGSEDLAYIGHDSCPDPLTDAKRTAQEHHEAYILSAIETPVSAWQDAAGDFEDGTWAVLWPGCYGPVTACRVDGKWAMAHEADLHHVAFAMPLDLLSIPVPPSTKEGGEA